MHSIFEIGAPFCCVLNLVIKSLARKKGNNWYIVKVIGLLNSLGQNNYIALITNWLHLIYYTFYIICIQHSSLVSDYRRYTVYFVLKKFKCKLSFKILPNAFFLCILIPWKQLKSKKVNFLSQFCNYLLKLVRCLVLYIFVMC